ncbi:hypothetical protein MLD38_009526 [Melastoma candidum]|uniref:Uncharacterized protein n=1 Tax=Melastoma candidum TaxID=119954 RepID=A0ACB9S0X2_9MYRT|nr:hypothetical protein MLD38_009526 [Melastoma candidum]
MARNHTVFAPATTATVLLLLLVVGASAAAAPAPAPSTSTTTPVASAPAPALDCTSYFTNLTDCLPYVVQGSNLTKPDKACCPELAGLVDSNPVCLCSLLQQASSFGVDVNRAMKLPAACSVSTPPISLCPELGYPIGVPTASEGPAGAPSTVPVATSPAGSTAPSIAQAPSAKEKNGAPLPYSPLAFSMGLVLGLVGLFFF